MLNFILIAYFSNTTSLQYTTAKFPSLRVDQLPSDLSVGNAVSLFRTILTTITNLAPRRTFRPERVYCPVLIRCHSVSQI